jgi:hypothetical protein
MIGTLAGWRAYALARGDNAPTAATDEVATAALVRASDYVQYRYVVNLCDEYDVTLDVVEYAAYVAASIELKTSGFFSRTYTAADQKVLTEVKGIKWTVVGKTDGAFASSPSSTLIEAMLAPYLKAACMLPAILVV